jgi:hypothetical protein
MRWDHGTLGYRRHFTCHTLDTYVKTRIPKLAPWEPLNATRLFGPDVRNS